MTPSGLQAVFRSSPHAWIALRLVYLGEVAKVPAETVAEKAAAYQQSWNRYVRHGTDMQQVANLIDADRQAASDIWQAIDQPEVDAAFSTVICEREPYPRLNLVTLAQRHYQLRVGKSVQAQERGRKLGKSDNQAAWISAAGICLGCSTITISQSRHDRLREIFATNPEGFDLTPTYRQTNGQDAPLWSKRVLIAAKGVADHILPHSQGGLAVPDNLANVCAACNYSRSNGSLDVVRVASYSSVQR